MRIEDLDPPRVVAGSADALCEDHAWLGLDWDEGPFFQSKREHAYLDAIDVLDKKGNLYPCTCSRKEIAAIASAPHKGMGVRYPGTCRSGATRPDRAASTRFRVPDLEPSFVDVLFGPCGGGEGPGDVVVRRADGVWAYQLAVVVDDINMEITEVIRGADLLGSTPLQIALYGALDCEPPRFFHVPLVVGSDAKRLSKRSGSMPLAELRRAGVPPARIVGALACSLGLLNEPRPITATQLVESFDVACLGRDPARVPEFLNSTEN